jgi:hypothetical protein
MTSLIIIAILACAVDELSKVPIAAAERKAIARIVLSPRWPDQVRSRNQAMAFRQIDGPIPANTAAVVRTLTRLKCR